jgi:4'-phosphopantetheinyl transferase
VERTAAREAPAVVDVAAAAPVPGAALDELLQPDELARADTYRGADDRARFVTGRALLRALLGQLAGCAPHDVQFDVRCSACGAPHGRPRPMRPATARDVRTSVSHAGRHVLVAASRTRVGIDVEACAAVGFTTFDEIALSPAEHRQLAVLPEAERAPARVQLWTEKEALLKLRGIGLGVSPASVDLGLAAGDRIVVDPTHSRVRIALTRLDVGPDYRACLAVESPVPPVIRRIDGNRLLAAAAVQASSASR